MSEFMSLREFLLLKDPFVADRSVHNYVNVWTVAEDFVKQYDRAKRLFDKYGECPPVGKVNWHRYPEQKGIFIGIDKDDSRCFQVKLENTESIFLVPISQWWLYFEPIDYAVEF